VSTDRSTEGHAFASYVREDVARIDKLQQLLEAAGIRVWRDTQDLWPGEDWRIKIRRAIKNDALVFLACFSSRGLAKLKSGQNDEIILAIEEIRLRQPDQPWLIPIRLDECDIPDWDIGGARTLSSLQRIDLFGDKVDQNIARLIATVVRLLGTNAGSQSTELPLSRIAIERLKSMLPMPERDIALDDLVSDQAQRTAAALSDKDLFPTSIPTSQVNSLRLITDQAHRYLRTAQPLAELLATGCAFGQPRHDPVWRRAIETVGRTVHSELSGTVSLLELRHLGLLPVLYAGALGAVARQNWSTLVAITTQAQIRDARDVKAAAISHANVWLPFTSDQLAPHVLARESDGEPLDEDAFNALRAGRFSKRLTPVSDALHDALRPALRSLVPDDRDYDETFDETEVLLGVLASASAIEAHTRGQYQHGAWTGAFTWRRRHDRHYEENLWRSRRGDLLDAGAFSGDAATAAATADAAFDTFPQRASEARQHHR
jgi:hypothetical protein